MIAGKRSGGGEPEYPIVKRPRAYENAKFHEGELEIHFDKHKAEYGGLGKDGYLKRAQGLLGEDVGGDILGYTRANGEVVRFNSRTGEWACGRPAGSISSRNAVHFQLSPAKWVPRTLIDQTFVTTSTA